MIELYFHLVHECKITPIFSKGNTFKKTKKTTTKNNKKPPKNVDIKVSAHDAFKE